MAAWEDPNGTERVFAIEPKRDGRIVGLIRITLDGEGGDMGNVGYRLHSDFQRRGYRRTSLR